MRGWCAKANAWMTLSLIGTFIAVFALLRKTKPQLTHFEPLEGTGYGRRLPQSTD